MTKIEYDPYIKHDADKAYELFLSVVANKNRFRIIKSLRRKRLNVSEISNETGINQSTVSHNLKRLRECGFVDVEKRGKLRYYKANKRIINPLLKLIEAHVCNCQKI